MKPRLNRSSKKKLYREKSVIFWRRGNIVLLDELVHGDDQVRHLVEFLDPILCLFEEGQVLDVLQGRFRRVFKAKLRVLDFVYDVIHVLAHQLRKKIVNRLNKVT